MEFSAKQIASFIHGEVIGEDNVTVHTFAKIEEGVAGALSFLANPKYAPFLYTTLSSIVLVNKDFVPEQEVKTTLIKTENVYESLAKLLQVYEGNKPKKQGVDSLAYIAPTARIGKNVYIGPFAYIGDGAVVGDDTLIYPHTFIGDGVNIGRECILYSNVNVYHDCRIGNHCIIHSGAVIGADGFGFASSAEGYEKIPQIGITVLEDNVEIGANTCIDRATMGATTIRTGVKLDNLIQIAHNDDIGSHTVMAAQVGVAGSTKVGKWCTIGGQVGLAGHIKVDDKVTIAAQSGIANHVNSNTKMMGSPAFDARQYVKSFIIYKKLPEIYSELSNLRKELDELKQQLNKK
ncbi:MAG: UDP-3-O-(3-hydroxymyristoyl)glucosamine N-acyltransferase [Mediterranea sp.]|jgi:UDP-3-O-[3-hydroxymyristoyl] glucosamine N-acyltransferase|nr:UDP-3-O-(3-hydroxymyristoyl)glucosamine N-acyltransferase [Mediterranea sp.]